MIRKILTRTVIGAALSVLSFASSAAPVTWVLTDVTFGADTGAGGTAGQYGGTASGSFTYDATAGANGTYSNVNITTTGTGIWGTGNCGNEKCDAYIRATSLYQGVLNSTNLQATNTLTDPLDANGYYGIALQFAGLGLTDAGGTVELDLSGPDGEGICAEVDCGPAASTSVSAFRAFSGGSVSAVPLPAAAWLFGSALLGLGALKRKKA